MNKPSWTPCCPNHGEPLEGLPFPLPTKGHGVCPVSKCRFDFEAETDEMETKVDKFGKPMKDVKWRVDGEEN